MGEDSTRERIARAVYEHRKQVKGYGRDERILGFDEATPSRHEECYAITDSVLAALAEPDITLINDVCSRLRAQGDTPDALITNDRHWVEAIWKATIAEASK